MRAEKAERSLAEKSVRAEAAAEAAAVCTERVRLALGETSAALSAREVVNVGATEI